MLGWPPPYREPFRRLLVHPTVVSRLNEFSGSGFRLDHGPLLISATEGTEGHYLHGSGEPFSPATWYHQQNGKIYCRGITVAWQLTDCNPGDGGFAVIPGSHKTCEPTPPEIRSLAEYGELVVQPALRAGDVLFFAETATHGTLPWKGKTQRRSVLYKYASRGAARATGKYFTPTGALRCLDRRTHARTASRPLRTRRPPQGTAPAGIRRPKNLGLRRAKMDARERYFWDLTGYSGRPQCPHRRGIEANAMPPSTTAWSGCSNPPKMAVPEASRTRFKALANRPSRTCSNCPIPIANPSAACWCIPKSSPTSTQCAARDSATTTALGSPTAPREPRASSCTAQASPTGPTWPTITRTGSSTALESP